MAGRQLWAAAALLLPFVSLAGCSPLESDSGNTIDPVCRKGVTQAGAPSARSPRGRTYSFCSYECLEKFRAHPAYYVGRRG
jgi:YHS domain-containing protein